MDGSGEGEIRPNDAHGPIARATRRPNIV